MRKRVAMAEIMTLKTTDLESEIAAILNDPDPAMQRRAISVLGALGSHVADEKLVENLRVIDDEALVKVSMETLFTLDAYCYEDLRPLLDHPYISVRETLVGLIRTHIDKYGDDVRRDFEEQVAAMDGASDNRLSTRAFRSLMEVLATAEIAPDEVLASAVTGLFTVEDWGVRADSVRIVNHWRDMVDAGLTSPDDPSALLLMIDLLEPIEEEMKTVFAEETDPYVLFVLGEGEK
jgi:hypothetical protein